MKKTATLAHSATDHALDMPGHLSESIVPVSSRELFWRAKFLREAPVLAHLPVLFWLVGDLRPRRAVTLNVGAGVGHFGLCQALEKTGLDAVCDGFGLWDGEVPEEVREYNADQYEEFSRLAALTPAKALRRVQKGSVDLLLVEGSEEIDLGGVLNDWSYKMSAHGVLVVTGLDDLAEEDAERLANWSEDKPCVRFAHGGGLLMVSFGSESALQLTRLSALDINSAAFLTIERIFARLGASHVNEWAAQDKGKWARGLADRLKLVQQDKDAAEAQVQQAVEKSTSLQLAYDQRQRKAAEAEAALHSLRAEAEEAQAQIAELTSERGGLKKALAAAETFAAKLRGDKDTAAAEREELTSRISALEAEGETLRGSAEATAQNLKMQVEAVTAERDALDADAARQQDSLKSALADVEEALAAQRVDAEKAGLAAEQASGALRQSLTEAEAARDAKAQQVITLEGEIVALTDLLDSESDRRITLTEELASLRRTQEESDQLHAQEIDALTEALVQAEERGIARGEEAKALSAKLQAQVDALKSEEKKSRDLSRRLAAQQKHNQALEETFEALKQSTSWKVTAPLRQATTVLRRKR